MIPLSQPPAAGIAGTCLHASLCQDFGVCRVIFSFLNSVVLRLVSIATVGVSTKLGQVNPVVHSHFVSGSRARNLIQDGMWTVLFILQADAAGADPPAR